MHFAAQLIRRTSWGSVFGIDVLEAVDGVADIVATGGVLPDVIVDADSELFTRGGDGVVLREVATGLLGNELDGAVVLEGHQDAHHVAERLVERTDIRCER